MGRLFLVPCLPEISSSLKLEESGRARINISESVFDICIHASGFLVDKQTGLVFPPPAGLVLHPEWDKGATKLQEVVLIRCNHYA